MAEVVFSAIYLFNVWNVVSKYSKFFIYFTCRVLFLKKKNPAFAALKSQVSKAYFPFCYYDNEILPQSQSPFRTLPSTPWIRTLKEKIYIFSPGFTNKNK